MLWIEPVIRALAARCRKLTIVTRYNELFENYPLANVRFRSDLNWMEKLWIRLGGGIILDGAYERAPMQHFLHAYQKAAGVPMTQEYPRLYLSEAEKAMDFEITGPLAVLHLETFTDKNYRKVYGVDFSAVAAFLSGRGYMVVQLGRNPAPIPRVRHITTNTREMIALLARASLFIGLDSGPSHLAAALGIPSVLFFGAVNPEYRHFSGLLKGIILQGPCAFAGCYHKAADPEKLVCQVVGATGEPPCSAHSTAAVLTAIDDVKRQADADQIYK